MMYKATKIIDEAFDKEGIYHHIEQHEDRELVCASFSVDKGPLLTVRLISQDSDNDVQICIPHMINRIPWRDRPRILKEINQVNNEMRFVKFCLDEEGNINAEYDVPIQCGDDCLGEVACEMFCRFVRIVSDKYETLARAVYEAEDENESGRGSFDVFMRHFPRKSGDEDDEADETEDDAGDDAGDDDDEDCVTDGEEEAGDGDADSEENPF